MSPYIDGLTLLSELRTANDTTPAIFLTSKKEESDKIAGFQAGCDDYLVKPFSLYELKLRVKALLRRTTQEQLLHFDDISIDVEHNLLQIDGKNVVIDQKALEILALFIANPNAVITMEQIIEALYRDKVPSYTVIRVHISKINALFETKRIVNIRGVGYRYESL